MQTQTGMEATELDKVEIYLSSGEKYRNEWSSLLGSLDPNLDQLRNLAFNGDLKVSKFRSVCWSILLRVLTSNPSDWSEQREQQRKRYEKLKEEFAKNPHDINSTSDNPLSQSKQSIWNQYFGDQELFSVIKQDVIRTFPGVDFFRKTFVQDAMTNILFYYAREHPYLSYRQGMHEILAPILFVMFYDHQSLLHFKELSENIDILLADVLNPNYLEEDCYSIFSRLMSSIESYYRIGNMISTSGAYFPAQNQPTSEIEVIGQLNLIRDKILAKEDQYLHKHLQKLEIPLQIFGIRWLRLLFGREFPLLDLLMMWDAIFAESDSFQLPNYILVAMLIRIRDKLILSDYTSCLTYLMRYPTNVDIGLILRHALHMHSPPKFERPPNAFVYVTVENENSQISPKPHFYQQFQINTILKKQQKQPKRSSSMANEDGYQLESDKLQRARSSSLTVTQNKNENLRSKKDISGSPPENHKIQSTIESIKEANTLKLTNIEKLKTSPNAGENVISDGFEESPEYLRLQLQNAQTVISVSRFKLGKYLSTLRKYYNKSPEDLSQVIDGIEELCAFLDVKFSAPSHVPLRVEAAFEANENQLKSDQSIHSTSMNPTTSDSSKSTLIYVDIENSKKEIQPINTPNISTSNVKSNASISDADIKKEFVKILKANKKHPYEIEVGENGNVLDFRTPSVKKNDISKSSDNSSSTVKNSTCYEIPDTGFMQNSHKVLGSRKDVELTIIKSETRTQHDGNLPNIDPLNLNEDERSD